MSEPMDRTKAIEVLKPLVNSYVDYANITMKEEDDNIVEALEMAIEALKAQLSREGTTSDLIRKFIDGLEETFAYIREREGGDSVCGLCEYDGAYIGESGDWCNECPGFDRDDCFKLSDKTRKKWAEEIIKTLPTIQPEILACGNGELVAKPEPQWIPIERELPRDGSWNIFTDGKNISVERYKADAIDHFFPNGRWFQLEDVIAWMPLPEPYQKGATP